MRQIQLFLLLSLACLSAFFSPLAAGSHEIAKDPDVQFTIIPEKNAIEPGQPFWVILDLHMADGWHSYWKNPGDAGMAPAITWNLPPGFTAAPIHWPTPNRFILNEIVGYGYEKEVLLLVEIIPPSQLPEQEIAIEAALQWLVCSDEQCIPGDQHANLNVQVSQKAAQVIAESASLFAKARQALPQMQSEGSASRVGDQIEVKVPLTTDPAHHDALFYPEEQGVIAPLEAITVSPSSDGEHLRLLIKTAEIPSKSLKGVIALRHQNDPSQIAYAAEIDFPIENALGAASLLPASSEAEGIIIALFLAFIGGLILNLMPCVLPVISLKILSFTKMAGKDRSLVFKHGAAFAFGVLISFWTLAAILMILQAYGRSVGWGFQLQDPTFVALLASLLLVMSLSLFGVFEIHLSLSHSKQSHSEGSSPMLQSMGNGVLATLLATPCTGPFLGSAIGYALTAPAYETMLIFTSMGLGMAFPYLCLAAFPKLLRFLPKPGAWMVTFKELMGFPLLLTVVWLIWVFQAQTNGVAVTMLLTGFWALALACWLYGKLAHASAGSIKRWVNIALVVLTLSGGAGLILTSTSQTILSLSAAESTANGDWEPFSAERIAELQQKGIPVIVDFTAKWCLICQANHLVLDSTRVSNKLAEQGVVKMKADWTKNDEAITQELRKHGRSGVPLYLLYEGDPKSPPKVLPQVLSPDIVLEHLGAI